jgi:hypothetical protein
MKKAKKEFDCVEFMHEAGREIMDKLKGMTVEERAAYWAERDRVLAAEDRKLRPKRKTA